MTKFAVRGAIYVAVLDIKAWGFVTLQDWDVGLKTVKTLAARQDCVWPLEGTAYDPEMQFHFLSMSRAFKSKPSADELSHPTTNRTSP